MRFRATDTATIGLFTSTPIGTSAQTFSMAGVPKDPGVAPAELMRRLPEQVALGDALLADDARTLQCIMRWVSAFPTARAAAR